jgi:prefoldin subunit 5
MQNVIEQEFDKMIAQMQELEKRIQELNVEGIRVNEELAATVEILKNQIDTVTTK